MTTLSQKYAKEDTRDDIKVNKTYMVPVEQLYLEDGYNIRDADPAHIRYFADCYKAGEPLPALIAEVTQKGIRIIDGQHRYLGAKLARSEGVPVLRLECKDFTGDEADKVALQISSSQGKALDPLERAKAYTRLKNLGWTNEQIAARVKRSVSDVQAHLSLGDVPAGMKEKIKQGMMSYATALEINREHGINAEEVAEKLAEGKEKITKADLKPKFSVKQARRVVELVVSAKEITFANEEQQNELAELLDSYWETMK